MLAAKLDARLPHRRRHRRAPRAAVPEDGAPRRARPGATTSWSSSSTGAGHLPLDTGRERGHALPRVARAGHHYKVGERVSASCGPSTEAPQGRAAFDRKAFRTPGDRLRVGRASTSARDSCSTTLRTPSADGRHALVRHARASDTRSSPARFALDARPRACQSTWVSSPPANEAPRRGRTAGPLHRVRPLLHGAASSTSRRSRSTSSRGPRSCACRSLAIVLTTPSACRAPAISTAEAPTVYEQPRLRVQQLRVCGLLRRCKAGEVPRPCAVPRRARAAPDGRRACWAPLLVPLRSCWTRSGQHLRRDAEIRRRHGERSGGVVAALGELRRRAGQGLSIREVLAPRAGPRRHGPWASVFRMPGLHSAGRSDVLRRSPLLSPQRSPRPAGHRRTRRLHASSRPQPATALLRARHPRPHAVLPPGGWLQAAYGSLEPTIRRLTNKIGHHGSDQLLRTQPIPGAHESDRGFHSIHGHLLRVADPAPGRAAPQGSVAAGEQDQTLGGARRKASSANFTLGLVPNRDSSPMRSPPSPRRTSLAATSTPR